MYILSFLRIHKYELQFFSRSYTCLFSVRFPSAKTPSSFHSLTLSSVILLQQILNCSSLSLCRVGILLVVISIDFVLLVLNTRLFLKDYFASELISLTSSLNACVQPRYKVESCPYCIQVLSGAMLDMYATQRLNNMGTSTESCKPYLAA